MSRQSTPAKDEDSTVNDRVGRVSPWPLFIAIGLGLSEVGIVFGLVPLAIGGILLFGGSCAGILHEAGYVASLWHPLRAIGGLFCVLGGGLWLIRLPTYTIQSGVQTIALDIVALRGVVILVAGGLLVATGLLGPIWETERSDMFG